MSTFFPHRLAGRDVVWQSVRRDRQSTLSRRNAAPVELKARQAAKPFKYRQQYGLIVVCKDEGDQRRKFGQLRKRGLTVRVVTV